MDDGLDPDKDTGGIPCPSMLGSFPTVPALAQCAHGIWSQAHASVYAPVTLPNPKTMNTMR